MNASKSHGRAIGKAALALAVIAGFATAIASPAEARCWWNGYRTVCSEPPPYYYDPPPPPVYYEPPPPVVYAPPPPVYYGPSFGIGIRIH